MCKKKLVPNEELFNVGFGARKKKACGKCFDAMYAKIL